MGRQFTQEGNGLTVVVDDVVDHTGNAAVHISSAEGLGIDILSDGGAHQVGAREEDAPRIPHDDAFVAHDGQVGSSRHAAAHDGRELGNARCTELGVVPEDAAEVLLVGEDLILHRQVDPRAVHEVKDGQVEFEGEFLGLRCFCP